MVSNSFYSALDVKRTLASLLVFALSFSLIAPAVFADGQGDAPSCCRRGGKHHCAGMGSRNQPDAGTGAAWRVFRSKCPLYPKAVAPAGAQTPLPAVAFAIAQPLPDQSAIPVSANTASPPFFKDSLYKRGPPSLS
jgi:hypothetical protein